MLSRCRNSSYLYLNQGIFMKLMTYLVTALFILPIGGVFASGYPADYCQQRVYIINDGPSLVARVGSGCTNLMVIGYKNSGVLASPELKEIDAIVTGSCNGVSSKITTVKLGKEWNGTGYINTPEYKELTPTECYKNESTTISIAYSDRLGNWDSRYGQNYNVSKNRLYSSETKNILSSSYGGNIGFDAWNIIINEMRN